MKNLSLIVFGDFRAANVEKITLSDSLKSLINSADIRACNFEAPVRGAGSSAVKSGPVLYQSSLSPEFLMNAGFNAVTLANNHIMDYGEEGCLKTIESFGPCITIGAGKARDAYAVKVFVKDGLRIGFLSLCQHEFGVIESADIEGVGAAWTHSLDVFEIIKAAKKSVDYLLVFPHAGVERSFAPLPQWRRLYKKYVEWGADGVIASHPHTPQGWEYYKEKPICYSLGNFYFDELSGDQYWNKGLAVELKLNGKVEMKVHSITFNDLGYIDIDESCGTLQHNAYINELLRSESQYNNYIDMFCNSLYDGHKYGLLRGFSGLSFHLKSKLVLRLFGLMLLNRRNVPTALNRIQCESHRWVIEHCLKKEM